MRIVTGTISHETNVLSNIVTDLNEFKKRRLLYGKALFEHFTGTKTPAGCIIEGCRRHGFELIPADIGDNPGGGAPEDGTYVLAAILEEGLEGGVLAVLWDPAAVTKALAVGEGQMVDIQLGGHTDNLHGAPLTVTARVTRFSDGTFTNEGPMGTGAESDMGPIAAEVIELDTPGLTSPRLAGFGFKNIRRPIFPLDVGMLGITELKTMEQD